MVRWIEDGDPLPPATAALGPGTELEGLVAAGGSVTVQRLEEAYRHGIFPWYGPGPPVLWWSPHPRMVLRTADFRLSHSLRKTLGRFRRTPGCEVLFDTAFDRVIAACAGTPRPGQDGTWIVADMVRAYSAWHRAGRVHSAETWIDGELVGGLYFVSIGRMCFGESMFAHRTDASKIALAGFVAACVARGIDWIDCQQNTAHLAAFGARDIPRADFLAHLSLRLPLDEPPQWRLDDSAWEQLLLRPEQAPPA